MLFVCFSDIILFMICLTVSNVSVLLVFFCSLFLLLFKFCFSSCLWCFFFVSVLMLMFFFTAKETAKKQRKETIIKKARLL